MLLKVEIKKNDLIEICHTLLAYISKESGKGESFKTGKELGRLEAIAEKWLRDMQNDRLP